MSKPSLAEESEDVASGSDTTDNDEKGLLSVIVQFMVFLAHLVHGPDIRDEDDASLVTPVAWFTVGNPQQEEGEDTAEPYQTGDERQVDVWPEDYRQLIQRCAENNIQRCEVSVLVLR